jgi:hypothetical protein
MRFAVRVFRFPSQLPLQSKSPSCLCSAILTLASSNERLMGKPLVVSSCASKSEPNILSWSIQSIHEWCRTRQASLNLAESNSTHSLYSREPTLSISEESNNIRHLAKCWLWTFWPSMNQARFEWNSQHQILDCQRGDSERFIPIQAPLHCDWVVVTSIWLSVDSINELFFLCLNVIRNFDSPL